MRRSVILLTTLFCSLAWAAPKDFAAITKESQTARESAAKEKDLSKRLKKFKDFEASLNATIKDYEKESPEEGSDAEEKVVKLSYRFEPVSELAGKKISKEGCEKTKERIAFEDRGNKDEDAKLTPAAEEALKWVDLLCN